MKAHPLSFRTIALLGAAILAAGCTTWMSAQGRIAPEPARAIPAPAVPASPPARAAHLPPASARFDAELANLKALSARARLAAEGAAAEFRRASSIHTSSIRTPSKSRTPI